MIDHRRLAGMPLLALWLVFAPSAPAQNVRGVWLGQDGHDRVGQSGRAEPNDVQDIHVRLDGLPRKEIALLSLKGLGGDEWNSKGQGSWLVLVERGKDVSKADLFFEPTRVETGRGFEVVIQFTDGSRAGFFIDGGRADPSKRMAGASMQAKWLGATKRDRVGEGPAVGPDGLPDCAIALEKLSGKTGIQSVRIEGPNGTWQSGINPDGANNAELDRDPKDPTRAEVLFQPSQGLKGPLKITVRYDGDREDSATLNPGKIDAASKSTMPKPPDLLVNKARAKWLGQDGKDLVGRGDVHVAIEDLPMTRPIIAVVLSNEVQTAYVWKNGEKANGLVLDPYPWPMEVKPGESGKSIHLLFQPDRDETGSTLLARIIYDDGKMTLVKVPGGKADIRLRSPSVGNRTIHAKPGEDLHRLVRTSATIQLAAGTYELDRPLELTEAVALVGQPGTTLRFTQKAGSPPWTAAIKVHRGNTRLEGFAVRFAGPIAWRPDVDFDPAVIGTTDNHDQGDHIHDPKAGIVLKRLDLESSPPKDTTGRVEAVALARLVRACGGRIEGCTLRGGLVRFTHGPWEIVDNDYRGTLPGTFAWTVFSCFNSHDLLLKGNKAMPVGPSGKTWRFLVQTVSGINDRVEGNTIERIGPRDDDTHQENAPEIILTEAYKLHFEGKVAGLSNDGRVLRVPHLQGDHARTGDVVAVLAGADAGKWSRVAQAIDPTTFLVDPPLTKDAGVVSIVTAFVNERYEKNTIDSRGGTVACNLVLVGNHFGLNVRENTLKGGGAFKITAAPSESPLHWGWSHAPCFDAMIEGNLLEDQGQPSVLAVEREGPVKTSRDRVYLTATLRNNVIAWTSAKPTGTRGSQDNIGLKLNDDTTPLDLGEARFQEAGNRSRGGPAKVRVHGATVNGKTVRDQVVLLEEEKTSAGAARR